MGASRFGSEKYLRANPAGFYIGNLGLVASTAIGANTLVGINTAGYADGSLDPGSGNYQGVCVAVEEMTGGASNGTVKSNKQLMLDRVILCEGTGFTVADVGKTVWATDEKTVTLTEGADGKPRAGNIVEFVSATRVWVHVTSDMVAGT